MYHKKTPQQAEAFLKLILFEINRRYQKYLKGEEWK
jgi:hypothetical protein